MSRPQGMSIFWFRPRRKNVMKEGQGPRNAVDSIPSSDLKSHADQLAAQPGRYEHARRTPTLPGRDRGLAPPRRKSRAALWLDNSNKYGLLTLMDENGKDRVVVGGNDSGGACTIQDKDGKNHVYIGSATNPSGGLVRLFGPQGKAVVEVGMNQ